MAAPAHTPTGGTFTVAGPPQVQLVRVYVAVPDLGGAVPPATTPTTGQLWPRGVV